MSILLSVPGPPPQEPIGLQLARVAKAVSRAFDAELAAAGGSTPVWLILLSLKQRNWETQRELAPAIGIEGPTLTHHLTALERSGLVERARDPENRRVVRVALTAAGDEAFTRLRGAALAFDRKLRSELGDGDVEQLRAALAALQVA